MGVTIIVGGQFGSEGKGKAALYFARKFHAAACVRVGGTNSGHTVLDKNGTAKIFRVLPTAAIDQDAYCVLAAGCYFEPDLLLQEIKLSGINPERIKIDPNAVIIKPEYGQGERSAGLVSNIASTGSGTGWAVAARAACDPNLLQAKHIPELKPYLCDTVAFLRDLLNKDENVIIEGTQGYGLSVLHTPYWPCCTSRDTTASGFLYEAGLSSFDVEHIVMVLRSYSIRVGGNSGPLPYETTWDEVTRRSGRKEPIREYTSVTKHLRRVALFDPALVRDAIAVNNPDIIVMNHLDYIPGEPGQFSPERIKFIRDIETSIGRKINYAGLNPDGLYPIPH